DIVSTDPTEIGYESYAPESQGSYDVRSSISFDEFLATEPPAELLSSVLVSTAGGALPPDRPCEDGCASGSPCVSSQPCVLGLCSFVPVTCDDQDRCTSDRCQVSGADAVCHHTNNFACVSASCGNGTLDAGEGCDPPDLILDTETAQPRCRLDCTSCGDGATQAVDDETCD